MITDELLSLFKEHVKQEYPKEAVGFVIDGTYVPQTNIAEDPTKAFKVLNYPKGKLQAILHSHPDVLIAVPSALDMEAQSASAVPWGIVATDGQWVGEIQWFGDQVEKQELVGRKFIHGVQDCYALVRDYYKQHKNVDLIDFPRDYEWWYDDKNTNLLTLENFNKAGFEEISYTDLRVGDVIVGAIKCERTNHTGIYIGQGLVLHHLYGRVSRREPLGPWKRFVRHYLRYVG